MNIKPFFIWSIILLSVFSCTSDTKEKTAVAKTYTQINGKTMGTTYTVKYFDQQSRNLKTAIDNLLKDVNNEVSTYEPESFISQFNKSKEEIQYLNIINKAEKTPNHFKANYEKSSEVYKNSSGYFDPTIMPIVNYWGFGYTEKRPILDVDKMKVDSLMEFVGFDKITRRGTKDGWVYLRKEKPGVQLDFSAIAKGYGVDAVAALLRSNDIENYYVEIGGELVVHGKNPQDGAWKIGINQPSEDAGLQAVQSVVELENQAMATSGNYRNFYEVDGVKYAHTINTKTGLPESNTLLSATVFASDCMTADAYATACMVMGLEKGMNMISQLAGIDAYFLYSDEAGNIQSKSTNANLKITN